MEKLHRQPDVTRQDYYAFVNELKLFHLNRGTPFRHLPRINGREIDLLKFYNQVTALGGLQKVVEKNRWDSIADVLNVPKSCANLALGLRQLYIRYLAHYEKIHFMGEVADHEKPQSSDSHRKQQLTFFHQVPMTYNVSQHEISETVRSASGLNKIFAQSTEYDKLCMSLLCGLPNEQELALNVCTILSNEGNYMLHLEHSPKLITFLLAQIGIWPQDDTSLKMLYLESWKNIKGRNMYRFWRNALDLKNSYVVQLLGLDLGEDDPNDRFFNLESEMGFYNLEGQRVLRVALIFHNLSFERNNVPVLILSSTFMRFLLLSIHSSWGNLKQTAFDTLSNLASYIKLSIEKDICSRIIFQTVMDGILSPDRYMNIRSMDILSQLCNYEPNEDIVPSRLDIEIYQQMVSFLTIPDIMLLFYTLEALYALSDLGRYACEKIVGIHKSIGALVSLLTLEPNQFGPSGQIKMKIIESNSSTENSHSNSKAVPVKNNLPPILSSEIDSETFAVNWLKSNFEVSQGVLVPRNEIYTEYVSFCSKSARKGVLNTNAFSNCMRNVFPQTVLKKIESDNGSIIFCYEDLTRKTTQSGHVQPSSNSVPQVPAVSVASPVSAKPGQKQTHSPILKAQLSAPPRSDVVSPPLKQPQSSAIVQQSVTPTAVSHTITPNLNSPPLGSSTLIKSLLANKVQQRNLQKNIFPTKLLFSPHDKISTRATATVIGIIGKSDKPTISSNHCIPQTNSSTRVAVAGSSSLTNDKYTKYITINSVTPTKLSIVKRGASCSIPCIINSQINGLPRNIQNDNSTHYQDDDSKSSEEVICNQVGQINSLNNHITNDSSFDTKDSFSCDGDSFSSKDIDTSCDTVKAFHFSQMEENFTNKDIDSEGFPLNHINEKSKCNSLSSEQNGSNCTIVNNINSINNSKNISPNRDVCTLPKTNSSSSNSLKSVLNEIDLSTDKLSSECLNQIDQTLKKAPLLNGLLDKGKVLVPNITETVENGEVTSESIVVPNEEKPPSSINSILNNVDTSSNTPSFTTKISISSTDFNYSSTTKNNSNSTILPMTTLCAAEGNLMEICSNPTTLSATIEVQSDQKGIVRLHIESPENSNQGSDLSSISDITKTLECASKTISITNAECNTQIPIGATDTAAIKHTDIQRTDENKSSSTVFNQSKQSSNITFHLLNMSKTDDLTDISQTHSNQLSSVQLSESTSISSNALKRPSNDAFCISDVDFKKARSIKSPLLDPSHLSTSVPCSHLKTLNAKPFIDSSSQSINSQIDATPSICSDEAIPVHNVELPNEKEEKTFSGLSSASDNPSLSSPPPMPMKSVSSPQLQYLCEWRDCFLTFSNPNLVFYHASRTHIPKSDEEDTICQWAGCDLLKRKRYSLLTHIQDWHCNENILRAQAVRRKQMCHQGKSAIPLPHKPLPHPGYAPDAALLAIRRHSFQYVNPKELSEEKESSLCKSIRLTSALILRNLVTHSSLARTYVRRHEGELAYLAMSSVESARTIAQCLSYISRPHE